MARSAERGEDPDSRRADLADMGRSVLRPYTILATRRPRLAARSSGDGRAGVGDVGVEGFDEGGEFLFDDAAFEFHGEGEAAIVEGEVVGEKSETLDGLPLGEMRCEAGDFVFDELFNERVRDHFLIRSESDSLLGGFGFDGDGIGNYQRDDEFTLIADDHGVENVRARFERVFDRLRRDEFPTSSFDQVFLAIGDEEIVVGIKVADVAGVEPAVFGENFARGVGALVVALHDARAFGKNFAVICDGDQDVGDGAAGTAYAIFRVVRGEDRRSLGKAVTLVNVDTDRPEKFGEFARKRRAAGEDDTKIAARALANFRIDELVGDGPLKFEPRAC